jgi:hypothetical protein
MKVVVSHSSKDVWVAKQIAEHLAARGIDTFLDENDLEAGDVFDEEIRAQIASCDEILRARDVIT